ncbi:MAG TPA: amidohydrolase family protein [Acidimicrobiales bacterium]
MRIISADSHVIEPPTLWQQYVDSVFRDRSPRLEQRDDTDVLVCDGVEFPPLALYAGCLRSDDEVRTTGRWEEDIPAAAYDPVERRKVVEADGISGEVLFPTVAMSFYALDDAALRAALFHAYNQWLAEFCATDPGFYKGLAAVDVEDIDNAVAELEECHAKGLCGAMIPLFAGTELRYASERYEPLWEAAARLRMPVNLHRATSRDKDAVWTKGTLADRVLRPPTEAQRVALDLIFTGVFDRHPDLVLVSAENEAGWAGHMTETADYWWRRNRKILNDPDLIRCAEPPSHYIGRNIAATFMRDRTAVLATPVTGPEMLMFGTDFPHHVSTWPDSVTNIQDQTACAAPEVAEAICWRNAANRYGFD